MSAGGPKPHLFPVPGPSGSAGGLGSAKAATRNVRDGGRLPLAAGGLLRCTREGRSDATMARCLLDKWKQVRGARTSGLVSGSQ